MMSGALEQALSAGDVACVLAEPAMTNVGIVHPQPGYHAALRELTRKHGTLLIIDETHTICAGPGGYTRAENLDPDVIVFGKAIGAGIPGAAYGFSQEVADRIVAKQELENCDVGGIGGTLAGNALSLAAMRATLTKVLTKEAFDRMIPMAERWTAGVAKAIAEAAAALACNASRMPRGISLWSRAEKWRSGARCNGFRAGAFHAPLRHEPRNSADALPQHGAHVSTDGSRRCRQTHESVPRGGEGVGRVSVLVVWSFCMKFPRMLLAVGAPLMFTACATIAPPQPPSLDLPKPPADLQGFAQGQSSHPHLDDSDGHYGPADDSHSRSDAHLPQSGCVDAMRNTSRRKPSGHCSSLRQIFEAETDVFPTLTRFPLRSKVTTPLLPRRMRLRC